MQPQGQLPENVRRHILQYVFGIVMLSIALVFGGLGFSIQLRSEGASLEPVPVDLAALEAGQPAPDRHVKLGRHLALFQATTYRIPATYRGDDPKAPIRAAWYPVLSANHPTTRELAALGRRYGGLEHVPVQRLPRLHQFAMIVRTRRFDTVGDIPDGGMWRDSLQGVTGGVLGWDQEDLLEKTFPGVDAGKILVLEEGVAPPDGAAAPGMLILAALAGGLGAWLFLLIPGAGEEEAPPTAAPLEAPPAPRRTAGQGVGRILRLGIAAVPCLIGLACLPVAYKQFQRWRISNPNPVAVDVASLERGMGAPNPHLRLDRHLALYQAAVYRPDVRKGETPGPGTGLKRCWYPVLSDSHPYMEQLRRLGARHGGPEKVPASQLPPLKDPAVYVRTKRFDTVGEIPSAGEWVESRNGLVEGTMDDLFRTVKEKLVGVPEGTELGKVLNFHEDRKPPKVWYPYATIAIGLFFLAMAGRIAIPRPT